MIVRGGTGLRRGAEQFLLRNWLVIVVVVLIEEAVIYAETRLDLFDPSAFSAGAIGLLATVVGIFLVFRFNEAYQRWWEARILWGGIVNASRSFSREVTTLLTPSRVPAIPSEAEARKLHRDLVYRHLAFINALRLHLRRQDRWEEIAPFLGRDELASLADVKNVPQHLVHTQGRFLANLIGTDVSQQVLLMQFDSTLNQLYDLQGACERIKNTAFPDEVRFVARALVWVIIISLPVVFLTPSVESTPLEIAAVLVITLSFLIVDQLGASLKNPFENEPNDTPMTALCRSIEIDLRQQLGETDLPAPLEPVRGILM